MGYDVAVMYELCLKGEAMQHLRGARVDARRPAWLSVSVIVRALIVVACLVVACGRGRAYAAQDGGLPIEVANDRVCKLVVTDAEIKSTGRLHFGYTLRNKGDGFLKLGADDDWTCDGRSVKAVTGVPRVEEGESIEDSFFLKDFDSSGELVVKGTLLLKDEDGDVVARYKFRFDDREHVDGLDERVDGEKFVRLWCGNYTYEMGERYPEPVGDGSRSDWLEKARSYVRAGSELYSELGDRYDDALGGKKVCSFSTKSLGASGDYERWQVTVRTAQSGWDDYRETTEYWLLYYAKDGKIDDVVKTSLSPKAT